MYIGRANQLFIVTLESDRVKVFCIIYKCEDVPDEACDAQAKRCPIKQIVLFFTVDKSQKFQNLTFLKFILYYLCVHEINY